MLETIQRLFAYGWWANARILSALGSAPGGHQKALRPLAHILVAERIWLLRLRGEDTSSVDKSPELSRDECERLADENRRAYAALLAALSDDGLNSPVTYRNFAGTEFHTPVGEILMHVALHGTYHRGQIAVAVREEGGTPAGTDFINFVRESGEASTP